jgi:hypothetical protein
MAQRSTLIRNEPCPKCGAYMIWTEHAWKIADMEGRVTADSPRASAYVCENPVCGLVLDPAKHPKDAAP